MIEKAVKDLSKKEKANSTTTDAISCVRLGAKSVTVVYRRTKEESPS